MKSILLERRSGHKPPSISQDSGSITYNNESKYSKRERPSRRPCRWIRNPRRTAGSLDVSYGCLVWPTATRAQSLGNAFEYAQKCIEMDDSNESCNRTLGHAYLLQKDYEKSLYYGRRSIELNPNSSKFCHHVWVDTEVCGEYEEAIREYERAMRLDPGQIGISFVPAGALPTS